MSKIFSRDPSDRQLALNNIISVNEEIRIPFGSHQFIEILRRCRNKKLTQSQTQVISVLSSGVATNSEIAGLTGMSITGVADTLEYLKNTGDVIVVGSKIVKGNKINIYDLSKQGKELVNKICPTNL